MTDFTYDEIVALTEQFSYRDKLRLAQLLIQFARKEEEEKNPEHRVVNVVPSSPDQETIQYVIERLIKLKPTRKASLLNSIGAMFQFQGGIPEDDKEKIIAELQRQLYITLDQNNRVSYRAEEQV